MEQKETPPRCGLLSLIGSAVSTITIFSAYIFEIFMTYHCYFLIRIKTSEQIIYIFRIFSLLLPSEEKAFKEFPEK